MRGLEQLIVNLAGPPQAPAQDLRPALPVWCGLWDVAPGAILAATEGFAVAVIRLDGGSVTFSLGEGQREPSLLGPSALAMAAARTVFQLRAEAPARLFVIGFDESLVRASALPALARRSGHYELRSGVSQDADGCSQIGRLLAQELTTATGAARAGVLALALIEYIVGMDAFVTRREAASPFAERGIDRVIHLIDQHIAASMSLEWLAKEAGISPYHLSRCFRASMGVNISRYIRERRFHFACKLLAESRKPLAEIAYDCGFSSQSRMNTVFRRLIDMTPLDYRRQCWRLDAHPSEASEACAVEDGIKVPAESLAS
jgi:AraC-like DNA-binding protein